MTTTLGRSSSLALWAALATLVLFTLLFLGATMSMMTPTGTTGAGEFEAGADVGLDAAQLEQAAIALKVADELNAPALAVLAMVCAGLGESGFRAIPNGAGSNYWGTFQGSKDVFAITDTKEQAWSFLEGGKGFQQGGAIHLAETRPSMSPGGIATRVEASGKPASFYGRFEAQAAQIIAAWKSGGGTLAEAPVELTPGQTARIAPDGRAIAPAGAPVEVKAMIAAGNAINGRPYTYGGGHPDFNVPGGLDCSSSTSRVLDAGDALGVNRSLVSGELARWGEAGAGRWVSVYANAGHAYIVVAGLRMDTGRYDDGPNSGESGPRWRRGERSKAGFVVRHPKGL